MTEPNHRHVALVTGGGRNIGAAIALDIARMGYDVVVASRSVTSETLQLVDQMLAAGVRATARVCDVGEAASVQALHSQLAAEGFLVDVLVNNASHRRHEAFFEITEDGWQDVLNVTLGGAFRCTQSFAPYMVEQGWGRVVNLVGVRGQTGAPGRAHQVAAKSGLVGLTRALAHELGPFGVTVNGVSPGTVVTDRDRANPARLDERVGGGVVGRFGTPQDIARAVSFLVGQCSGYITGQVLGINGGELMT